MNINKIIFLSSTLALLLFIYGTSSGIISKYNDSEAQRFFASIRPEDRDSFIRHYLRAGLKDADLRQSRMDTSKYTELSPPEGFANNLVAWTMEEFQMTESDVAVLAHSNQVCFPNGLCFNVGDVGTNCCPF